MIDKPFSQTLCQLKDVYIDCFKFPVGYHRFWITDNATEPEFTFPQTPPLVFVFFFNLSPILSLISSCGGNQWGFQELYLSYQASSSPYLVTESLMTFLECEMPLIWLEPVAML